MNHHERELLRHAADDDLLYHKGTWGDAAGYRWRGPDGTEAGTVPPWEADRLDALADRGLINIEHKLGPHDCRVTTTSAGRDILSDRARAA